MLNREYKINPTPIKTIKNLITQGNLEGGKKAKIPTVKNKSPTIKLYKSTIISFSPLLTLI